MILLTSDKSSIHTSITTLFSYTSTPRGRKVKRPLFGSHVLTYRFTILSTYTNQAYTFRMQTIVSLHTYVYDCFSIYTYIYTIHFNYLNSRTHQHYVDFLKCYFQVKQVLGDKDWT